MELNQYHIVLVNLDPTVGVEMTKTRLCVIISPNEMNKYLQTIVIAPMKSSSKPCPTRVEVKQQTIKGWVVLDKLRSVDRIRVIKVLGSLTENELEKVKAVIKEAYVD